MRQDIFSPLYRLKDLVTRTEINKFVNDLVNLDRVRSLLKTIYYRRQFKAKMEEKQRQQRFEQGKKSNHKVLKNRTDALYF